MQTAQKILPFFVLMLLFLGACRTPKQISSTSALVVDTTRATVPVDTILNIQYALRETEITPQKTTLDYYNEAYAEIEQMLIGRNKLSFKKAVFVSENAFFDNKLTYAIYNDYIKYLSLVSKTFQQSFKLSNYKEKDSLNFSLNGSIFVVMKDTLRIVESSNREIHLPFTYDFEDFFGSNSWEKTFVFKLLSSHSGNCRSLPYLYKIIADEIGAKCWLSLAPQHMYIKNYSKQLGWYNTELTSKEFPTEGWVMASGYITLESIQNGIFMDTIGTKQAVALCLVDLANGYSRKEKNSDGSFVLKCCDLSLKYFPTNINAMLLKAETLKEIYLKSKDDIIYKQMLGLYLKIHKLGYREIPEKMYIEWIQSLETQKDKFVNKKISETFKPLTK